MAINDELRFRVQRFLTGPFDACDLTKLFLFLRGKSVGRQSVRDLGNMIGHADIRDQGISVYRVRDAQTIALYKMRRLMANSTTLDLEDAPPTLLAVMDAAFNLLDDETIMRETGLTRNQIGTNLTRIKRKFSVKSSGNIFWDNSFINEKEISIIKCLTEFLISEDVYSSSELIEDTLYLLLKYKFMDDNQIDLFYSKSDYLLIFAVASMHGVMFDCPEGIPTEAVAGWTTSGEKTYLNVSVTFPIQDDPEIKLGLSLFTTELHPSIYSEDYVEGERHISFDCPIEITEEGKLRCMI